MGSGGTPSLRTPHPPSLRPRPLHLSKQRRQCCSSLQCHNSRCHFLSSHSRSKPWTPLVLETWDPCPPLPHPHPSSTCRSSCLAMHRLPTPLPLAFPSEGPVLWEGAPLLMTPSLASLASLLSGHQKPLSPLLLPETCLVSEEWLGGDRIFCHLLPRVFQDVSVGLVPARTALWDQLVFCLMRDFIQQIQWNHFFHYTPNIKRSWL